MVGVPLTGARVWVQWKGTDACFDFHCLCENEDPNDDFGHWDGYGAYAIQCGRCGRKYDLPQTLELKKYSGSWEPVLVGGFNE